MLQVAGTPSNGIDRPGIHRLLLMRAVIVPRDLTAIRAGINNVGIIGLGSDVSALAAAHLIPVRAIDTAIEPGAGDRDG